MYIELSLVFVGFAYPNLRDVSEEPSSTGGSLMQLLTLFVDSNETPSSCIPIFDSIKKCIFVLRTIAIASISVSAS